MISIPWEKDPSQKQFSFACFPLREKYLGGATNKIVKALMHDVDVISFDVEGDVEVYLKNICISVSDESLIEFYGLYVCGADIDKYVMRKCSWVNSPGPMALTEILARLDCSTIIIGSEAGEAISRNIEEIFADNVPRLVSVSNGSKEEKKGRVVTKVEFDMPATRFSIEYSNISHKIPEVDRSFIQLKEKYMAASRSLHNTMVENPRISYANDLTFNLLMSNQKRSSA